MSLNPVSNPNSQPIAHPPSPTRVAPGTQAPFSLSPQLVAPQAPNFSLITRIFNWLWSWIRPLFTWCLPATSPSKALSKPPVSPPASPTAPPKAPVTPPAPPLPSPQQVQRAIQLAKQRQALQEAEKIKQEQLQQKQQLWNLGMLSVNIAAHSILKLQSAHLIVGHTLCSKIAPHVKSFLWSPKTAPQINYKRALLVGTIATTALYFGIKMYQAVNDGVVDGSIAEQAGEGAAKLIHHTTNWFDYLWESKPLPTPLKLGIPFTSYSWEGGIYLPLAIGPASIAIDSIVKRVLPTPISDIASIATESTNKFLVFAITNHVLFGIVTPSALWAKEIMATHPIKSACALASCASAYFATRKQQFQTN